ncbi:nitroreductase family deazaflavin-dependent oxidoreductase [Streptomyces sp. NPDC055056]
MSERLQRNQSVIDEFRSVGGIEGGDFEGVPRLLLTTTGARTGKPRTTPLTYQRHGQRLVVFAANGGREEHPAWYRNLFANPLARTEIDSDTYAVTATAIGGAERERLWDRQLEHTPLFADFQDRAGRGTPVFALPRITD